MTKDYNPDMTLVERDKRKTPYSNNKMSNPYVTWSLIAAVVVATGTGTFFISRLEAGIAQATSADLARHLSAMEAINHERDMRQITSNNVNENVDEVKEEVKDLKDQMKEDNKETQRLLRELLQKQGSSTS